MPLVQTKGAGSAQGVGQFARQVAANYIEDVFSTYLYTGNSSTQTITNGIDLAGKGGMTWFKWRTSAAGENHVVWDSVRTGALETNTTASEAGVGRPKNVYVTYTSSGVSLLNSNPVFNASTATYASWTFRKQAKFFDVVTYTGNGTGGRTIAHSLGSVPGCIIVKGTTYGSNWTVYHRSLGAGNRLRLDETSAAAAAGQTWGSTTPTSTVFTVGGEGLEVNNSGQTYVAYLFAHDAGGFGAAGTDNVISCGSFTTDGSGNATVTLGWEPQWMITKSSSQVEDWYINDTARGFFATPSGAVSGLSANTTSGEAGTRRQHVTSTGFTVEGGLSANQQYVYIAIRRGPMRAPTSGTSVFGMQTYADVSLGSTAPIVLGSSVGFPVDTAIAAIRTSTAANVNRFWGDRLRGRPELSTISSTVESNTDIVGWGWQAGVQVTTAGNWYYFNGNAGSRTFVGYFFRRAPGFFDVVCYTGTGVARTVSHSLSAVPELIIVKTRSDNGPNWMVYNASGGLSQFLSLNSTDAYVSSTNLWGTSSPTAALFNLAGSGTYYTYVNNNGSTYVAYLFATLPGVSKVGSYTGTGAAQTIDCGFTGGARFVLIKRTNGTGDWYVWDTARGITAGSDPFLLLNSTAAETTGTDYISVQSSGFGLTATAPAAINANGSSYIFLAIA